MSKKNEANVQVIENAALEDVRAGDHITWVHAEEAYGVTIRHHREGVARYLDGFGDWRTEGGEWLTDGKGEHVSITIRRPIIKEG